ncbi:AbrB/MazE/SpoVT family DNA-binding domain-containing protein [Candidatus Venteria ishoeyi]|uniref:Antitoxin MazE n=1 Tax=Candidatus Venteria ishoeyi TaxID=1899563 RepID=A0A1H6FCT3_9GAMM|nr:AbrB/MazE/SpoVT family DNA-binding domain-containing protein [Candidatus Venteria ishoeyi]SEH06966.1 Antitoxin MazE [Candidatus Venteria ishoeyi]
MQTVIQKWGNSLATRIPASLVNELHLKQGEQMNIKVDSGRLIIEPVRHKYTLDELVDAMEPDNLDSETDWGYVEGKEVF